MLINLKELSQRIDSYREAMIELQIALSAASGCRTGKWRRRGIA